MAKPEIVSETPVNMNELKKELDAIKKHDKELNFRAQKTEEYLQQFCDMDEKKSKELFDKLEGLKVPRLKDIHINKIIDTVPKTLEELKVILQGYTITVNNDNLKRIVEAVKAVV